METSSKFGGVLVTPTKERATRSNRSKFNEKLKCCENLDPNVSNPAAPNLTHLSPIVNFGNIDKKIGSRRGNLNHVKIRERKFVVAKKKSRNEEGKFSASLVACEKCKQLTGKYKCLCVAYESLRASHEDFFRNRTEIDKEVNLARECDGDEGEKESNGENDELCLKRSRDKLLEEARESVPESGFGRVMHLVKAFEKLRMISKSQEIEGEEAEHDKEGLKWALPGLQQPPKFLTSESLGLNPGPFHSFDSSSHGSFSISTRTSAGGEQSRRSSTEPSGTFVRRHWKRKQKKATSQKPFMLTTEQRGRHKEEELMKKLQKELKEEEKLRIHIAQGIPRTTDKPEIPMKPPVKEITKPVDLVLKSDTRAVERAEFDHQVAKKMNLIEHYRAEMERQERLAEEEEIKRLRKELVPKAHPMPFFDRPFVPRRSMKLPTIPKEPKLHLPQRKKIKCYRSLDDLFTKLE
ncbi:hypothetical protein ACS0TY_006022 [Phlomoides rotata]